MAVVQVDGDIDCSHTGEATTTPTSKLTVSGVKVLVKADVLAAAGFAGCTNVPPPGGRVACTAVASVSLGEATKLTCGGAGVVLDSLVGVTNSTPVAGSLVADSSQSKLTAV